MENQRAMRQYNWAMNTLARYLELIVDPTFDDFHANRGSIRHAFLACVTISHAVDRLAEAEGRKAAHFHQMWGNESLEFTIVDIIANHFKHVKSTAERIPASRPGLPIGRALGFNEAGDEMDLRNLYFVIRDAVRFVHRKAGTTHPALPESPPQRRVATRDSGKSPAAGGLMERAAEE